jgi:hypothetical protein
MDDWPFDDPPDTAATTVRSVMDRSKPVLLVVRYADDGSWSFLTGEEFRMSEAMLVGLGRVLAVDPTVAELADLPPGWQAWRERVGAAWQREPHHEEAG